MGAIIAYGADLVWPAYRIVLAALIVLGGGVAIANLFIDSEALGDAVTIVFGALVIVLFARDLRKTGRDLLIARLAVACGVLLILATIGDRLT
jgi:hypothetical protein